ncbi:MAG: hypothetical protein EON58_07990 [Alphaproteobacteria bacterium]|nr:MAG: hypothetical protein EON58_07990 [Alphaproteobacteria bacterium]
MRNGMLILLTIVEGALPFLRSVLIARMLSPSDFGVTVALAIALTLPEMVLELGFDAQAVKAAIDDDDPKALPTLQTLAIVRSTLGAGLLAIAAPFFFAGMDAELSPLVLTLLLTSVWLRGFSNLGFKALMARGAYLPDATLMAAVQLIWTVGCVAWAIFDPRPLSVAVGMLLATCVQVVVGFRLAAIPFRAGFSRVSAVQAIRFGLPLLPNGILLGMVAQGDRLVVGGILGASSLAVFSAVLTLCMTPRALMIKLLNNIALPQFLRSTRDAREFDKASRLWLASLALIAALFSIGFICFGALLTRTLFGVQYAPTQIVVVLVGLSTYCRFLFGLLIPVAMSLNRTGYVLRQTCMSLAALLFGSFALLIEGSIESFFAGALVGDLVVLVFVLWSAISSFRFPAPRAIILACGGLIFVSVAAAATLSFPSSFAVSFVVCGCLTVLLIAITTEILRRSGVSRRDMIAFWSVGGRDTRLAEQGAASSRAQDDYGAKVET